ncbi:hypothetical protein HZB60_09815 [candidate division KSB1 bacterium]|nr:hypothetical protein [candidate division KSB1 bacterium]
MTPSRMDVRRLVLATAICLLNGLTPNAQAELKSWNNPSGGSWHNALNWTPAGVPTVTDDAEIVLAGTYSVTVDSSAAIQQLILGAVSGGQTLELFDGVGQPVTLEVDAPGEIRTNGRMRVFAGNQFRVVAAGGPFVNHGVITFDSSTTLHLGPLCSLDNAADGTIFFNGDVLVESGLFPATNSDLINNGVIVKSGSGLLDIQTWCHHHWLAQFTLAEGSMQACYFFSGGQLLLQSGTVYTVSVQDTNSVLWIDSSVVVELQGTAEILSTDQVLSNIHNNGVVRHTGPGTGIIDCEHEHEVYGLTFPGQVIVEEGTLHFRGPHNFSFFDRVEIGPEAELIFDNNAEFSAPAEVASTVPDSGTLTFRNAFVHQVWFCTFTFSGILQLHGPGLVQVFPTNTLDTLQVLRADSGVVCEANQPIYTRDFELNGGTINTDVIVIEEQTWTAGGLGDGTGDSVTIEPGATLVISGPDQKQLDGSTLTIEGTAHVSGSGELTATNGANIIVATEGLVAIGDSVTITSPADSLINHGQMTISSPLDTSRFDIFIFNDPVATRTPGTIDVLSGRVVFGSGVESRGTINVGSGAELIIGGALNNGGSVNLVSGGELTVTGTLSNSPSGTLNMSGDTEIGGGGALQNDGQINSFGGVFSNLTNRAVTPRLVNLAAGFVDSFSDTLTLFGGGENHGDIEIHAGTVLKILGEFENASEGLIHGQGVLDVSEAVFVNNGTINPGSSPGTLVINGDLTTNGTIVIELAETNSGTEFDLLVITGALQFGGTLELSRLNGFLPVVGDVFDCMHYGGMTGEFADVRGTALGDGHYVEIEYGPNSLTQRVCDGVSGVSLSRSSVAAIVDAGESRDIPIEICNVGHCPLEWNATFEQVNPSSPPAVPWLTIMPGTAGLLKRGNCEVLQLHVDLDGLPTGIYTGSITVAHNDPSQGPLHVPVRIATPDALDFCNDEPLVTYQARSIMPPTIVTHTRNGVLSLHWMTVPGVDFYQIYYGTSPDAMEPVSISFEPAWVDTAAMVPAGARIGFYQVSALRTQPIVFSQDDALAYWRFEEGSGNTSADESGHGHDATLHNADWYEYGVDSQMCWGLGFANSKWADVVNDNMFYMAPLQIDAHLKIDQLPAASPSYILGNVRYAPLNGGFAWRIEPSGLLTALAWNGNGWNELHSVVPVMLNEWFTATLIINGDESMMLVNGTVVAAGRLLLNSANNEMPLTIGASALPSGAHQYFLRGQIGWMKLRELTLP